MYQKKDKNILQKISPHLSLFNMLQYCSLQDIRKGEPHISLESV